MKPANVLCGFFYACDLLTLNGGLKYSLNTIKKFLSYKKYCIFFSLNLKNNTKMKKPIIAMSLASCLLFSSCLGSFQAFNNLKDWNQGVSESKFVNNLIFWGLNIVPVYGLFFLGDALIFNVIEFWSGSNPVAMKEGEREVQIVERDGNTYEMVAMKNRIYLKVIEGPKKGNKLEVFYKPDEKSWNAIRPDGRMFKLSSMEEGIYMVYLPDGKKIQIDPEMRREEGVALLQEYKDCYLMEGMLAEAR